MDLYYQDMNTNSFDPYTNWTLLAKELGKDEKEITFLDKFPTDLKGRYYLVVKTGSLEKAGISSISSKENVSANNAPPSLNNNHNSHGNDPSPHADISQQDESKETPINIKDGKIIYVDIKTGNDAYSGRSLVIKDNHGPKKTLKAGLDTVPEGGTLIIEGGIYHEDFDVSGRKMKLQINGDILLQRSDRSTK